MYSMETMLGEAPPQIQESQQIISPASSSVPRQSINGFSGYFESNDRNEAVGSSDSGAGIMRRRRGPQQQGNGPATLRHGIAPRRIRLQCKMQVHAGSVMPTVLSSMPNEEPKANAIEVRSSYMEIL